MDMDTILKFFYEYNVSGGKVTIIQYLVYQYNLH
jgi:hypothetical protein